jgi:hypothetical protein
MNRRQLPRSIAFALVIALVGANATLSADLVPEGLDEATAFRLEFGLPSDTPFVLGTLRDATLSREFGVPLTDEEVAELHRRAGWDLEALITELESEPRFAGIWIDQAAGGVIEIALTASDASVIQLVEANAPEGASLRIRTDAAYSWSYLQELKERIGADVRELKSVALNIRKVYADPITNRVVVGVDQVGDRAETRLRQRYGDAITVSEEDRMYTANHGCVGRDHCPSPLKGGLKIYRSNNPDWWCTAGYMGRKTAGAVAGEWYMITAGHCTALAGGVGKNWSHGGQVVGQSHAQNFGNWMVADVAVIKVTRESPANRVYVLLGDHRNVTSKRSDANQQVGTGVCRGGATSNNWVCGQISAADVIREVCEPGGGPCHMFNHAWEMNKGSQGGDSGGPIGYGTYNGTHQAYGVLSYGGSGVTGYSTIDWIAVALPYRPCYTANSDPC